jgi:hypothetical protein
LLEIKTWVIKWKKNNWRNRWMGGMVMDKCEGRQRKSCITKTKYKHFKGGYGRLPSSNVYTCHGFFLNAQVWKSWFQNIFSQVYSTIFQQRIK